MQAHKRKIGESTYEGSHSQYIVNNNTTSVELVEPSLVQHATSRTSVQPDITLQALDILQDRGVLTSTRAQAVRACDPTRRFTLICGGCGNLASIRAAGCNSRICFHCAKGRRGKLFNRLKTVFATFDRLRFLTIGFKNTPTIDNGYFKQCSAQFDLVKKYLKREGYEFGTYVNVLEVKYHRAGEPIIERSSGKTIGTYETAQWNVHYHVLFDGDYIPQASAQKAVEKATRGESFYAYIKEIKASHTQQPVTDSKKALSYVIKYLGKLDGHDGNANVLAEFYTATEGIRFYNVGLKKKDRIYKQQPMKLTCTECGSQNWITVYQEPKEFEKLAAGREPNPDGAFLQAIRPPQPVVTIADDLRMQVTFEDVGLDDTKPVVTKRDVLNYISQPRGFKEIETHFEIDADSVETILAKLRTDGDIMQIKPGVYIRLQ